LQRTLHWVRNEKKSLARKSRDKQQESTMSETENPKRNGTAPEAVRGENRRKTTDVTVC
jgi:uncharacterized membrane protein